MTIKMNLASEKKTSCFAFYLPIALLFASPSLFAESRDSAGTHQFGFSGETTGFLDNLEYFNPHRPGETIFGASSKIRFFFRPSRHTFFSVGVFGLRRFGDERFLTRVLPLFCVRYATDRFSLLLGEIVAAQAHGLPDMLYKKELIWDPGTEEGIQMMWRYGGVTQEVWVNWDSLTTPSRREHFVAGNATRATLGPFSFPIFLIAEHFGGQLFASPFPVQNGYAGAAGIELRLPLRNFLNRIDAGVLGAGSMTNVRDAHTDRTYGGAARVRAGASPGGFDCSLEWYTGNDFTAPLGNPIYKSNKPVVAAEIAKSYSANRYLTASGGIRFEAIDNTVSTYIKNPQYRWWLALRGGFAENVDFGLRHRE